MAGVGKTTLAKKVFDDQMIQRHFECRAWIKVGRKCESNDILRCILAQVDPNTHRQVLTQGEDDDDIEKLVGVLEERLKNKKCLIVLDDVWEWDTGIMDNLQIENVRILLTSRIRLVESPIQQLCLLNKNESVKLLGEKVFGEGVSHLTLMNLERRLPTNEKLWNMKELQYIQVMGRDLPASNSDASLDKLSGLHGVSEKSCTREILKRIPNLKILSIRMELEPYDDDDNNSLSGLDFNLEELYNLDGLSYQVVNPDMKYARIFDLSMFPSSLTKLILFGSGCPWEHMTDIGLLLPNLMQLTLRCYACRGPEWVIESRCFLKLKILKIEGTDMVRWRAQQGSLPRLNLLSIRHCYKLRQLDWTSDPSMVTTHYIELIECNPLAVASTKQLRLESLFKLRCHSSF